MTDQPLAQLLLLLGTAVAAVVAFQRLRIPSSLAYLAVGVLLGPHTPGPVVEGGSLRALAEFGIVFLLFTIGLNFSLPQILALRHLVLGLGTGQVVLTTAAVGAAAWFVGLPPAAAFVVGAVFAQSSTTIITRQLLEQGEEHTRHGRLATAMSVFQDVTAVPFLVVIPVLGATAAAAALPTALAWALAQAVLAFAIVYLAGRWLLRPLFHAVASRHSAELFTLTALFVALAAAWTTQRLGLSMAFGAFLVGMILGETEFRHQVESAIRPFRDVLLGLFFVAVGMLFDPAAILVVWHWALAGAAVLLAVKTVLVAQLVHRAGIDPVLAWRTGLLLAVGGEFGLALLAIALDSQAIAPPAGQAVLAAVLLSMVAAPFLIRHNLRLAARFAPAPVVPQEDRLPGLDRLSGDALRDHVILCGYGRIGQSVGNLLAEETIAFVALDLDSARVREAHAAGAPVYYGDAAEADTLDAAGLRTARLLVITHDDLPAALLALRHARTVRPDLPVMVRTRDERHADELRAAGATEVVPETLEAGLMIASHALLVLAVPAQRVVRRMQDQRRERYRLLREAFKGGSGLEPAGEPPEADRLRPVLLAAGSGAIGHRLGELALEGVAVSALVRRGRREVDPPRDTLLEEGDALVLVGLPDDLHRAAALIGAGAGTRTLQPEEERQ